MRVAIDCRGLRKQPVGVPNFLIAVINHLAVSRKDCVFYLLSNEEFNSEVKKKLKVPQNVILVIEPLILFPSISTLWYFVKMPIILRRLKIDFFYSPIPSLPLFLPKKINTMITVHDMVYKLFPKTMSIENRFVNFLIHDRSVRKANKLWAISSYTKSEIERFYPIRKSKEIFVGTAVENSIYHSQVLNSTQREELCEKYQIRSPFILTVGTLEPRKNLQFLLSMFPLLAKKNFQIAIVGATGWGNFETTLKDAAHSSDHIKFLGFTSDEDLVKLYSLASVYISTSLNEGLCMPLLEAMHCGCPVVAAHNSGMIEVVEGAGETVKGWDTQEWVEAIEKAASRREYYAEKGYAKSKQYRWEEVIARLNQHFVNT